MSKFLFNRRMVALFSFFFYCFMIFELSVYAEDDSSSMKYEVKPVLDDEQKKMGIDYFYSVVHPNEKKEFEIEIINHAKKASTFNVEINNAMTNSNGMIDYSLNTKKEHPQFDFQRFVKTPKQEVLIDGQTSKKIAFTFDIPQEQFEGILLGGIYVSKQEENTSVKQSEEGIELSHKLSYAIAIMLQEKVPYDQGSDLKLDSLKVDSVDNQSVLIYSLENPMPNILNKVNLKTDIYKKDDNNIFATIKKESMSFAPNDKFELSIPWDQKEMQEGNYKSISVFTSGEKRWEFEHYFSITKMDRLNIEEKGNKLNKAYNDSNTVYLIIIFSLLILLFIILLILMWNRKRGRE